VFLAMAGALLYPALGGAEELKRSSWFSGRSAFDGVLESFEVKESSRKLKPYQMELETRQAPIPYLRTDVLAIHFNFKGKTYELRGPFRKGARIEDFELPAPYRKGADLADFENPELHIYIGFDEVLSPESPNYFRVLASSKEKELKDYLYDGRRFLLDINDMKLDAAAPWVWTRE